MLKVFVIEDDPDILELEIEELKEFGFSASGTQGHIEAKNFLANEKYDCILLDMNLGPVSGKEIIDLLKSEKHMNHTTPILIVSGSLDVDIVRDVRSYIRGVLVKPVQSEDLINKIKDVTAKAKIAPVAVKKPKNVVAQNISVLVVDDDIDFSYTLKDCLTNDDMRVVAAHKSTEALKKLNNQRFDVIIMDIHLDARHGDWIIAQIRKDKSNLNHQTPVIIVSGQDPADLHEVKSLVQGIYRKPIKIEELALKIRDAYNIRKEQLKVAA